MTKLFNNADYVANASGMAAAIKNKSVKGRRQRGKSAAAEIGSVRNIISSYGSRATVARENVMADKKNSWADCGRTPVCQDALARWEGLLGSGDVLALIAQPVKPWTTKKYSWCRWYFCRLALAVIWPVLSLG